MKHQTTINLLSEDIANYILEDREREDYEAYCEDNDLDAEDYLNNASLKSAHVFAKAKALLFHLEQLGQKQAEGGLK